ncbi:transporter substrate-binding domain-containing protein [Rheinheimera sp.]|uniref:substrate-binding periplasmic protein n=1 Tax=Rheinheimera sp. TaxID=1869214 RepID=UPI00307EC763
MFRIAVLLVLCALPLFAAEPLILRYPQLAEVSDQRSEYPLALLTLALKKMDLKAVLAPTEQPLSKSRAIALLQQERELDVIWTMTSKEKEASLLPVRIPLMKGLGAYRALLIRQGTQHLFEADLSLKRFKQRILAQGHDWVDTQILRAHRFTVQGASDYPTLFQMLDKGRVDAVPRAVTEIMPELKRYQQQGAAIAVEPNWLLHYPGAVYFFVAPSQTALAALIEQGLEKAIADGSFDQLFEQHFAADIQQLQLAQRHVIELENPFLPQATPLERKELWYKPKSKRYTELTLDKPQN